MFGTRKEFTYLECSCCGRLRISEEPPNLGDYYPSTYNPYSVGTQSALKTQLRQQLVSFAIHHPWFVRAIAPQRFVTAKQAHALRLKPEMRILDVGCGAGMLVRDLRAAGFNAIGVDRFAPQISDAHGLVVKQCELQDITQEFDCILFNHSLEHINDQVGTLRLAQSKLAKNGICIVRIPIVNWAWKEYKTDWVQLDPPRHQTLHTEKSFGLAAEQAGFSVFDTVHDSLDFQFWGSELIRLGVPLETGMGRLPDYFSKQRRLEFSRHAEELNQKRLGDQAIFFLRRIEC